MRSKGLVLGFDLDGVICDIDHYELKLLDTVRKVDPSLEHWYYVSRKPKLNPATFTGKDDKVVIITSRPKRYAWLTKKWLAEHGIQHDELVFVECPPREHLMSFDQWCDIMAEVKARAIKQHNIDIYFEDLPWVVERLRQIVGARVVQVV